MELIFLTPARMVLHRPKLLRFIQSYGEGRITHRGIRWLKSIEAEEGEKPGTLFLIAKENHQLAGFFAVLDYGRKESLIVVHPKYRNQGLGRRMIEESLIKLGRFYGRVALDNLPSLHMVFGLGMVGFKLTKGPTGKPTLWVGIGQWRREDVQ